MSVGEFVGYVRRVWYVVLVEEFLQCRCESVSGMAVG